MNTQIKTKSNKMVVECLLCYREIHLGVGTKIGKFITCQHCEMVYEIIAVDPLMIDWPYHGIEEDLDDDIDGFGD